MTAAAALATAAYADARDAVVTPRQAEYRVFARITHRLSVAQDAVDVGGTAGARAFPRLVETVSENRRLWSTLATDLAATANGLPDELRAQLISLAIFTVSHTDRVLARQASARPLVDINTAVMRGLRGGLEAE